MKNSTTIPKDCIEVFYEEYLKEEFKSDNGEYFVKIVWEGGEVVVDWNLDIEEKKGMNVMKITIDKIRGSLTFTGMREIVTAGDKSYYDGEDKEKITLDIDKLNWDLNLKVYWDKGTSMNKEFVHTVKPEDIEFNFATEEIGIFF